MSLESTFPGVRGAVRYIRWEPSSEVLRVAIMIPCSTAEDAGDGFAALLAPAILPFGCALYRLLNTVGNASEAVIADVSRLVSIARGEHGGAPLVALCSPAERSVAEALALPAFEVGHHDAEEPRVVAERFGAFIAGLSL